MALLQLITAGTMSNTAGTELTTAVNLANNIHEWSLGLAFTNATNPTSTTYKDSGGPTAYTYIWDLNGDTYSPPLDVTANPINMYGSWSQQVTVSSVDPNNVTAVRPNSVTLPNARITVTITHNGKQIYSASWLVSAPNS